MYSMSQKKTFLIVALILAFGIYNTIQSKPEILTKREALLAATTRPLNLFTVPSLPILKITAPAFSIIPLEKLPTYQGKKLPQNELELVKDRISDKLPLKTVTTNPIAEGLMSFKNQLLNAEDAAINIYCSQKVGNQRKVITGSGVLIHKDGTVLTNAHVAQYPLIADGDNSVVCMARSGQIPTKTYSVKTVFISPEWSVVNAPHIKTGGTEQTGEHDFALLQISSADDISALPMPINTDVLPTGSKIQLVSYPADTLATNPKALLTRQKDSLSLLSYYSLGHSQADAITTSPTHLAQRGSSGGLIADQNNKLIGIVSIVTHVTGSNVKQIRGISTSHINNSLSKYINNGLIKASNEGSAEILKYFNTNYRVNLTNLFKKYL